MDFSLTFEAGAEAFGSGEHPSTSLALHLLAGVIECGHDPEYVLDMGCGSGILGITAAKLTQARVLAADINKKSVKATLQNAKANGVETRLQAVRSDGYNHREIQEESPYNLVLCNVLAEPLVAWAGELRRVLAPGGFAILSGMLAWHTQQVIEAHMQAGLACFTEIGKDEWRAVLLGFPE